MGLEDELEGFVKPYQGLLLRMANFITPFVIGERPVSDASALAEKREQFLALFKQLPFPNNARIIKAEFDEKQFGEDSPVWHEVKSFCSDLTVYGFDYSQYRITFYLHNRSIDLGDQQFQILSRTPFPGNSLSEDADIHFKDPKEVDWKRVEPKSSRSMRHIEYPVFRNESPYGLMEANCMGTGTGYFLSKKGLREGYSPIVRVGTGGKSVMDTITKYTYLKEAKFPLRKLGSGELTAFMKHVGYV